MKFLLALVVSIALALATSPLVFTEEASSGGQGLTQAEKKALSQGPFTLETTAEDSPETAKFKAALRLLNAYTVALNQLSGCAATPKDPVIVKAMSGYHSRNGTVMSHVMRVVKQNGGLTLDIRDVLDKRAAELMWADPRRGNCPALIRHITEGGEDLYKAPRHIYDYQVLRDRAN